MTYTDIGIGIVLGVILCIAVNWAYQRFMSPTIPDRTWTMCENDAGEHVIRYTCQKCGKTYEVKCETRWIGDVEVNFPAKDIICQC